MIADSFPVYYYFYSQDEIDSKQKSYQCNFYGDESDLLILCEDDDCECFYAIFRNFPSTSRNNQSVLKFKNSDRLLINSGTAIYHFYINERICEKVDAGYGFFSEEESHIYSLSSSEDEIMVITNNKGLVAINWNTILWTHPFRYAFAGYLIPLKIIDHVLHIEYFDGSNGNDLLLMLDIFTGKIIEERLRSH